MTRLTRWTPIILSCLALPLFSETSSVTSKWATQFYGVAELDQIYDSTQSFDDLAGNRAVAVPGTYAGDHGKWTTSVRQSILGFRVSSPEVFKIKPSAVAEVDFRGNQPPGIPESAILTNPSIRIRHFYMKFETPIVDLVLGQTWSIFGWQSLYFPVAVQYQGLPAQLFSRTPQFTISKKFSFSHMTIEGALGAMRPAQSASDVPEGQVGIRLSYDGWTGKHTSGIVSTSIQPLSLAVSSTVRRIAVPVTTNSTISVSQTGWGLAVDGFVPIWPKNLSLLGEYVYGYGIGDQYTALGGGFSQAGLIDPGIAQFNTDGSFSLTHRQTYRLGIEFYLPGDFIWMSSNYGRSESNNSVGSKDWVDGNLFAEFFPGFRAGLEYAYTQDNNADRVTAPSHRIQLSGFYAF